MYSYCSSERIVAHMSTIFPQVISVKGLGWAIMYATVTRGAQMSAGEGTVTDRRVLVEVARAYYLDDKPKTQIADDLGLSRFKVARLLEQARNDGIVRISVMDGLVRDDDLAAALRGHLQLSEVIVVAGADDEDANRDALAQAAADYLARTIQPGDTFGFSWGRTLAAIGGHIELLPESTLVALTGGVGTDFEQSPVEVLRGVAGRSQVRTMSIFAPMFVDSAATAAGLRRTHAIASVLDTYAELDLAVLSVGSWNPPITQLTESLSADERHELDRAGVRAEVVGIFIRDDGRPVDTSSLVERRISVSAQQLIDTPGVLAVAGGVDKAPALAAVARSRVITALITDERTAATLLKGPAVPAGPRVLPG